MILRTLPEELEIARKIMAAACDVHGINFTEISSRRRSRFIVEARWQAMSLTMSATRLSTPAVGKFWGHHHSTVLHAMKMSKQYSELYPLFRKQMEAVKAKYNSKYAIPGSEI